MYRFDLAGYHRCPQCGLVFLSPRLKEAAMIDLYSAAEYFRGGHRLGYDAYVEDEEAQERTFRRRLQAIQDQRPSGRRLLDVGCGPGRFVQLARRDGWDAFGIDVSKHAVEHAVVDRQYLHCGRLSDVDPGQGRFDVITLFDVFEHLYDPRQFVRQVDGLLAPGGMLVVATPNFDSLMRRVLGKRTVSFKIPEHVAYYSPRTLAIAVGERFTIKQCASIGQYCTPKFLEGRLRDLSDSIGRIFSMTVPWLNRRGWMVYVYSGSLLAKLVRR